jgi:hypothetical protein
MIASVIAAALLLASNPTAPQRKAYNACLEKFTMKSFEDRLELAAFESALPTACAAEAATLRKSALAADLKAGRKAADSASMIDGDFEDYKANAMEIFRDFKSKSAKAEAPAPQPQPQPQQ